MIIYALVLVAILFFLSWNLLIQKRWLHLLTAAVTTLLLLLTVAFSIANFNHHYGMHLVKHTRTENLASVSKRFPMLVYEKIGSAQKHEIVAYKHNGDSHKLHTRPNVRVKNQIIRSGTRRPKLRVTHQTWQYRSGIAMRWFGLAQKPQRQTTLNRFYVPKRWLVLSANQVKVMETTAKRMGRRSAQQAATPQAKVALKQKVSAYVRASLVKAMKKNPHLSPAAKRKITKRAIYSIKSRVKQKALARIMPKALIRAKKSPKGYVA